MSKRTSNTLSEKIIDITTVYTLYINVAIQSTIQASFTISHKHNVESMDDLGVYFSLFFKKYCRLRCSLHPEDTHII